MCGAGRATQRREEARSGRLVLSGLAAGIDMDHLHDLYFARDTATV
jgi:hypothetical protein